jgi:hypothetical protein
MDVMIHQIFIPDIIRTRKLWNKIIKWLEYSGRARAAAELNRQGKYDIARKLMAENID